MRLLEPIQLLFTVFSIGSSWVLIPEDVATFLNLLYTKLPPIRLGIENTKVGLGFRMGRNVDVQFLVELGPQASTTRSPAASKRTVPPTKELDLQRAPDRLKTTEMSFIQRFLRRRPAVTESVKTTTTEEPTEIPSTESDIMENEIETSMDT